MKLRMHTIAVLLRKDCKLMLSNRNVLIMLLLPIGFAILYQNLFTGVSHNNGVPISFVITLCSLLNIVAVGLNGLAMMVAEEKEKNTLRVLMLSDVSSLEYIVSKLLLMLFATEIIGFFVFIITNSPMQALMPYLLITTLVSLSILLFGAVVGLISKDQMSTGTISTPLMILFLIPPMFAELNDIIANIAKLVPTAALYDMINIMMQGKSIFAASQVLNYVSIFAWIIISIIVFAFIYKKKTMDN